MQGLEPVVRIKDVVQILEREDHTIHKLVHDSEEKTNVIETTCQCVCNPGNIESPDLVKLKEPLSAPF